VESIKAWVYYGKRDLRFMDVKMKPLEPDEVRIEVYRSGLCSTDVEEYFEGPIFKDRLPMIIGREFGGKVVEVGKGVSKEWIGKLVSVVPAVSCGECDYCLRSREDLCPNLGYYGLMKYDGGMAEYANVRVKNIVPVSNVDILSFGELTAVSLEAVEKVRRITEIGLEDSKILIVGGGIVGAVLGLILRMNDVKVLFCENRKTRADMLRKIDFEVVESMGDLPNDRFDLVFDCAGHDVLLPPALPMSLMKLKPGGILLLMGIYSMEILDFRWDVLLRKEISIIPSIFYRRKSIGRISHYLEGISEHVKKLITLVKPQDLKKYLEECGLDKGKYMRIVVEWKKV